MTRRTAMVLASLLAAATLWATASPASAAPLQDFYLTSNNGVRTAVAQGVQVNGTGTFVPTGPTSETILIGTTSPILMTRTPIRHVETLDARSCRATVVETGTFEYSQSQGEVTVGGSGPYILAGTRVGRHVPGGCAFSSPQPTQYAITARATEIHAVA
jgi:hypothetical protein